MDFQLTGTVNLAETHSIKEREIEDTGLSGRYQFVYASQLYNTFFGIFVKFQSSNIDLQKKSCTIEAAEFVLVNYSGVVNLGITNVDNVDFKNYPITNNGNSVNLMCLNFDITVKALERGFKPYIETLKTALSIDLRKEKEIYLRINRKIKPLSETNAEPNFEDIIFDSEKYNRSGVYYNERNVINNNPTRRINNSDTKEMFAPWGSCIPGYNKIIIG